MTTHSCKNVKHHRETHEPHRFVEVSAHNKHFSTHTPHGNPAGHIWRNIICLKNIICPIVASSYVAPAFTKRCIMSCSVPHTEEYPRRAITTSGNSFGLPLEWLVRCTVENVFAEGPVHQPPAMTSPPPMGSWSPGTAAARAAASPEPHTASTPTAMSRSGTTGAAREANDADDEARQSSPRLKTPPSPNPSRAALGAEGDDSGPCPPWPSPPTCSTSSKESASS